MPTYTAPGVYVEEVVSSQKILAAAPTAVAAFVGFTASFPTDDRKDPDGLAPRLVTSWSDYVAKYGGFAEGCMLPISVFGYFANGGSIAYICRVPHNKPADEVTTLALPAADKALKRPVKLASKEKQARLTVEIITEEPKALGSGDGKDDVDPDAPATFTMHVFEPGQREPSETFTGLGIDPKQDNNVKTALKESKLVDVEFDLAEDANLTSSLILIEPGVYTLESAEPESISVSGRSFAGSATERTGIDGLTIADDVTMVVVPDLITAATKADGQVDLNMWKAVQTSLISHCEQHGNRMAILDAPPGMDVQSIREWRSEVAMYDSKYAAMYYPWVTVEHPAPVEGGDTQISIPPSGHIAGVWARTDETRGVWKAPANDTIRGVLDLERDITQTEQGLLNPIGINCIRPFGTRGMRIWGARTLSSDTDWNYINVRRLFNMVESTILEGTHYAVFEPNDVALWEGVKRTVSNFLRGLWTAGALTGLTPDEAFYVKCDAENNPPESVDAGFLFVEVGIAPVKPAEFIVFKLSQKKQVAG